MKDQYRGIPAKVSSLRHNMNEFLTIRMRRVGWDKISPSHGGIIYALLTYKVLSMKEIAQKVKRDPSTVTTLVNKLINLGYAEYTKNPKDLRSKQVRLTQKGMELYDEFNKISLDLTSALSQGITDEEMDMFIKVTDKINKNVLKAMDR